MIIYYKPLEMNSKDESSVTETIDCAPSSQITIRYIQKMITNAGKNIYLHSLEIGGVNGNATNLSGTN